MKKIISFLMLMASLTSTLSVSAEEATLPPAEVPASADQTVTLLIIVGIVTVIAVVLFFIVKQPQKNK